MRPQMLIMFSGALLILCGIPMVAYQSYSEITSKRSGFAPQSTSVTPSQIASALRDRGRGEAR